MPRLASGLPFGADLPTVRQEKLNADLLAKGDAVPPRDPLSDVMDFPYSQNRLHPTQKPSQAIEPLVRAFRKPDGIVLDPFRGSSSTLVTARAEWAAAALRHFHCTIGTEYDDALIDLLCDLHHWCNREKVSFASALKRARGHSRGIAV